MPEVGRVLGGRYRLIELLGEGGMATIYRAHDNQLDRDVAVKLLRPQYGRDAGFIARFRQEAQSAASLNHPSVVNVYDYGTDEAGPFIVMELVDGADLAEVLRERGFFPAVAAASIAEQVAEALAAAHQHGIVHRDVKPSNILVTGDGRVKVVDFGIARALVEAQLTLPGTTLGSVHYFSPEQARGEPVTAASDVYALGLVLFEMLTGRRAWTGDTAGAVALARLGGPAPRPSSFRAGVPGALDAIVGKALALDPQDRFPSAGAMGASLRAFLGDPSAPAVLAPAPSRDVPPAAPAAGAAMAGAGALVAAGDASRASPAPGPDFASLPARSGAVPLPGPAAGTRPGVTVDRTTGRVPGGAYTPAGSHAPASGYAPGAAYSPGPYGPVGGAPIEPEPAERRGGSAWAWAAGLLGLLILLLAAAAFAIVLTNGLGRSTPVPVMVNVPSYIGQQYAVAKAAAAAAPGRLTLVIGATASPQQPGQQPNTIIGQDPGAGAPVPRGSTVTVTVVAGAGTVAVPDIFNLPEGEALRKIIDANLQPGQRTTASSDTVPLGSIISQNPNAGFEVAAGQPVDYVVSTGPAASPSVPGSPAVTSPPSVEPTLPPTPEPTPPPPPTYPITPPPTPVPS